MEDPALDARLKAIETALVTVVFNTGQTKRVIEALDQSTEHAMARAVPSGASDKLVAEIEQAAKRLAQILRVLENKMAAKKK